MVKGSEEKSSTTEVQEEEESDSKIDSNMSRNGRAKKFCPIPTMEHVVTGQQECVGQRRKEIQTNLEFIFLAPEWETKEFRSEQKDRQQDMGTGGKRPDMEFLRRRSSNKNFE
jgi:hypothetical protein